MLPRTQRQKEILDYITRFVERHGYCPSYTQIARHFGVKSRATIGKHIAALERRGLLDRKHIEGSFTLDVKVDESESLCEIKLLGQIAAGSPIDVVECEETIPVPRFLLGQVRPNHVFALQVKGDSMIGKNIASGDYVIVEQGKTPQTGDVVAALIDNESTLKTYMTKGGKPVLRAENPKYPDLIPAAELSIQGVMVALVRKAK
jgi:repressor LexA